MEPPGVDPHVDADDLVIAGAGLGVDLAGEEGRSVRGHVPAVLQEEPLQVVHLFAHALAGAQGLGGGRGGGRVEKPSVTCGRALSVPSTGADLVLVQNPVGPVVRFAFDFGYGHDGLQVLLAAVCFTNG